MGRPIQKFDLTETKLIEKPTLSLLGNPHESSSASVPLVPPIKQQTDSLRTVDAFDDLSEMNFTVESPDGTKLVKLPEFTLNQGERLRVNIVREPFTPLGSESQATGNFSTVPGYNIMEPNPGILEDTDMFQSSTPIKIIFTILNISIKVFFASSIFFLFIGLIGVLLPRADAFFGFFLCLITGILFTADKWYRKVINQ
ncbi:hypothetical protein [Brevibacillus choshinensis]|uniref:hypothetical protein n=1 Tax=Brevibacillus choshinensis TaxID=54911 RepID=UPI002E1C0BA0|nr:hypothetical protein [Brevibacillus choshinensis]